MSSGDSSPRSRRSLLVLLPSVALLLVLLFPDCSSFPTNLEPQNVAPPDKREGWYHKLFLQEKVFSDSFRFACIFRSSHFLPSIYTLFAAIASSPSLFLTFVRKLHGSACCYRARTPVAGPMMATAACSCWKLSIRSRSSTASLPSTAT